MKIKYVTEYRILGKNGGECFRSRSLEETKAKLESLKASRPRVNFTQQARWCRLDKDGDLYRSCSHDIMWSCWA